MTNIREEILKLKMEKGAIILAHYYQIPEIQEIADYVGDSYYLSKVAKESKEKLIVFCGVKFMAESAKILSPEKTILLPALDAGCPMADMADGEAVREMKKKYPSAKVVCYINSTAEVKSECDVCCTSSNAVNIIKNIEEEEIIFLPDKNLGSFIQQQVPEKKMILWDGYCITHKKVKRDEVLKTKDIHSGIKVLVHPECEREIWELADFVGSTGEIIQYATESKAEKFLIVTEQGIMHELQKKNPNKKFYTPYGSMTCPNMKKTRLENLHSCLENLSNEITVDEETRLKAHSALMNMHILGR